MLYSGFNNLPRSVFRSANFNGRSDNTDVIRLTGDLLVTNDPLKGQLTVGELRRIIAGVPDTAVVALSIPPAPHNRHALAVLCNLTVEHRGPVVLMRPSPSEALRVLPSSSTAIADIPPSIKSALYWFVSDLTKGLLEHDQWDFESDDFETGRFDWDRYTRALLDPTVLTTTVSIWMNNLAFDAQGNASNVEYSSFRAMQYLRTQFDDTFELHAIAPALAAWELREWQTTDE